MDHNKEAVPRLSIPLHVIRLTPGTYGCADIDSVSRHIWNHSLNTFPLPRRIIQFSKAVTKPADPPTLPVDALGIIYWG